MSESDLQEFSFTGDAIWTHPPGSRGDTILPHSQGRTEGQNLIHSLDYSSWVLAMRSVPYDPLQGISREKRNKPQVQMVRGKTAIRMFPQGDLHDY
ncbi:uncharacterized protein AAG666_023619 isoform 4-T17 [Megaptera novaeangliae]